MRCMGLIKVFLKYKGPIYDCKRFLFQRTCDLARLTSVKIDHMCPEPRKTGVNEPFTVDNEQNEFF